MPGMEESTGEMHATGNVNQTTVKTASNGAFTLQVTTRLVDLGLIALDKHGKPVTDLRQDEIEVYDNGRKQQVRGFHHSGPKPDAQPQTSAQTSEPEDTFTNTPITTSVIGGPPDTLILLLDESHLPFQDLNRARGEVLRFLAATRPTSRIALYAFSEHGFRVIQDITQDHALVSKKLATWMPAASSVSQAQELDARNRQQFDTVRSATDLNHVNGNFTEVPDYIQSTDPQLRQLGQNPLRASLEAMLAVAQHFAAVPGHKSLAWIAGDSVLADWDDAAVGIDKSVKQMDAALRHAREALAEAHIALYAVDASAQNGGAIDASLENRNIEVNQVSRDNPQGGGNARISSPGRIQAQMQSDLHGIQGPVRQLVESTGGRAINRGGDLKATLDSIDLDSTARYDLTFNPDTQADGKFHTLQLKVPSRKDVKLRYRTGYLYTEQAPDTKQRMTQAIWSPQDLTAITLTVEALNAADSGSGKNTIKLRIGFPGLSFQQKDAGASASPTTRWTDQLYIFIAERDDASQKATVDGDTLRLSLKQATYDSGMPAGIPYQHEIQTRAKLGSIRVIVVDGNSGKMGSVTLPTSTFRP
jgi:VWFA-related protein